MTEKIV